MEAEGEKLTREQIWKLKGKRLEKALGVALGDQMLRPYCTDANATMGLALHVSKLPEMVGADECFRLSCVDCWWTCSFGIHLAPNGKKSWYESEHYIGTGKSAGEAVGRAALMALFGNRSELEPSPIVNPAAKRKKGN